MTLYVEIGHDSFLNNDFKFPELYRSLILMYWDLKASVQEQIQERNIVLFRIVHKME